MEDIINIIGYVWLFFAAISFGYHFSEDVKGIYGHIKNFVSKIFGGNK